MTNQHPERGFLDHPPLIPRILIGDARTTRSAWSKLVTKAWKAGSWNNILDDLELVPAARDPGNICLESWKGVPHSKEIFGRVYWVNGLLQKRAMDVSRLTKVEAIDRLHSLLLSGMKHFWFTAGMLESGYGDLFLSAWPRSKSRRELSLAFLRKFIHWMPEWDTWDPYRFDISQHLGGDKSDGLWLLTLDSLARDLGFDIDVMNFRSNHAGSTSAAFAAAGLISRGSNGYELNVRTLDELLSQSHSPNGVLRSCAARAIGAYGVEARPLLPRLLEMQSDPDEQVRGAAKFAVEELTRSSDA
jgi:hypothetical protein